MKKIFLATFVLTTLTASLPVSAIMRAGVEKVFEYSVDSEGVTFYVDSEGHTEKDMFEVSHTSESPIEITLIRKEDEIRGLESKCSVALRWTKQELGIAPNSELRVMNELLDYKKPSDNRINAHHDHRETIGKMKNIGRNGVTWNLGG